MPFESEWVPLNQRSTDIKDKVDQILQMQTIKRFGTFEDISNVIDFFIDEKSNFITGQKLYLGGLW